MTDQVNSDAAPPTYNKEYRTWTHACGCIEIGNPYRRYPCARHRVTLRELGAGLLAVGVLFLTAASLLILGWLLVLAVKVSDPL